MTLNQVLPLIQGLFSTVLFLGGMALWGFAMGMMRLSSDLVQAVWWERAALIMIGLTSASYFLFVRRYANVGLPIGGLLAGLFLLATAALAPTDLLAKGMDRDVFGNAPVWGPAFPLWMLANYAFVVTAIVRLEQARRASPSYEMRNRYLHFILGASFSLAGAAIDVVSAAGLRLYPMGIPANIVFSLLTAVAILKYHLLDIRVTLRRGLIYLITSSLIAVPLVLVPGLTLWLLGTLGVSKWWLIAPLAVLALFFEPLWRRAQDFLERRFYGQRYDHLRALERFSDLSIGTTDMNDLCSLIVGWAARTLQPDFVCLLTASAQGEFSVAASAGEEPKAQIRLEEDSPLAAWLKRNPAPLWRRELDVFPQLQAMRIEEREALDAFGAVLYSPIVAEEQLIGILAVGPKRAGQLYTREDLQMLSTLCRQAFLNLENVRLLKLERERVFHLEKLEQMKSDFLLSVSHQLKTPLTSVKVSAGILADTGRSISDEVLTKLVGEIGSGVRELETQISSILDLAKVENATLELNRQPSDVKQLISQAVDMVAPQMRLKEQSVELDLGESVITATLDSYRFRQIVANLVSNANKFTPRGGRVSIRLRQDMTGLLLEVRDNGIGIAPEQQQKIFLPYYQVSDGSGKAPDGTGLGLAITKGLVDLHRGRIWVDSRPGEGAAFFVSLPTGEEPK